IPLRCDIDVEIVIVTAYIYVYGSDLLNFRLMLLLCHRYFRCRYSWRDDGHRIIHSTVNEAVMNQTLNGVCRGIKSLLGETILPINNKGTILVISIVKGYVQNEPVNQTLWLAYTYSMPPILSLPLSMACDDSDGCVTMLIG
ncbi:hypothetical protein Tco_1412883, partial [Tanacetum coccineum]